MSKRIHELIKRVDTDISGKWISNEQAEILVQLVIDECVSQAHNVSTLRGVTDDMIYGADTAASQIKKYFSC